MGRGNWLISVNLTTLIMDPVIVLLTLSLILILVLGILIVIHNRSIFTRTKEMNAKLDDLAISFPRLEKYLSDDQRQNREETTRQARENREELGNSLRDFRKEMTENLNHLTEQNRSVIERLISSMDEKQEKMVGVTEKRLEEIRVTVDEKLQKTLNERLGQSFELVGRQLENVQKGLGEMQVLAQDVGGLKRVLSNVKLRGGIGEVQLAMLLEQILAPEQYAANVKTRPGSNELVEFAIRLPGRDDANGVVWLPIDAKFPRDVYEQLQDAWDGSDPQAIELAQRNLENAIRKMAKDIRDKYIEPPYTTDFGIMFLPFEGIYAEVVRKASLLEDLQRTYGIVVTGPSTLAAILNSLQMGFKTLAIQKRSSEVWKVLGVVKKEFESFAGMLSKAQNNIQVGLNQLDDVMGKRTRAIQRKLRQVETSTDTDPQWMLDEAEDDE
ncbi:DNA anti-recombination protein (rearrangement mutator) RmuC [Bacteroidales bacterium 6E]|nr:DNA anti-recombination protein (rearrangement mutator) RmuC [Bacteroidales bacterium 6E]